MRKLLILAFIVTGLFGLGPFTQHAFAMPPCSANSTEKRVNDGFRLCWDACKGLPNNQMDGCHASCTKTLDTCLKQVKEDQKKSENESVRQIHCHDPIVACSGKCLKETNNDQKKCKERCETSEVMSTYHQCLKPR